MLERPTSAVAEKAAQALTLCLAPPWQSILVSIPIFSILGLELSDQHVYSPVLGPQAKSKDPSSPLAEKQCCGDGYVLLSMSGLHSLFIE